MYVDEREDSLTSSARRASSKLLPASPRRALLGTFAAALVCLLAVPAAGAANPIQLVLDQGAAFSIVGHSCGGIQEKVYATGFASNGYPTGEALLSTSCGGSGRGGGGKSTTYTGAASVVWTWFGETRSFAKLEGAGAGNPTFSAEDTHGDRIYNENTRAYLQTGEPPLQAPGAPTGVTTSVGLYESGENEYLRLTVGWTPAPETAGLLRSATVTATPVKPGPPVLSTTVTNGWSLGYLAPMEPNTTYEVTVTNTDSEGTSEAGSTEVTTPNSDGEGQKEREERERKEKEQEEKEKHALETCQTNSGTIKLSPGLTETPAVQSITVKGTLGGCSGAAAATSATYVEHLTTKEEVGCWTLSSISAEPTTTATSLTVKWTPKVNGTSGGLLMPLTEIAGVPIEGKLEGGPFSSPLSVVGGTVSESFTGGPTCGIAEGKKQPKAVKSGTFTGTALELG